MTNLWTGVVGKDNQAWTAELSGREENIIIIQRILDYSGIPLPLQQPNFVEFAILILSVITIITLQHEGTPY